MKRNFEKIHADKRAAKAARRAANKKIMEKTAMIKAAAKAAAKKKAEFAAFCDDEAYEYYASCGEHGGIYD